MWSGLKLQNLFFKLRLFICFWMRDASAWGNKVILKYFGRNWSTPFLGGITHPQKGKWDANSVLPFLARNNNPYLSTDIDIRAFHSIFSRFYWWPPTGFAINSETYSPWYWTQTRLCRVERKTFRKKSLTSHFTGPWWAVIWQLDK